MDDRPVTVTIRDYLRQYEMLDDDALRAAIRDYLRAERIQKKDAATQLGISPQFFNDYLQGRRTAGMRLPRALGLVRVIAYRRAP